VRTGSHETLFTIYSINYLEFIPQSKKVSEYIFNVSPIISLMSGPTILFEYSIQFPVSENVGPLFGLLLLSKLDYDKWIF